MIRVTMRDDQSGETETVELPSTDYAVVACTWTEAHAVICDRIQAKYGEMRLWKATELADLAVEAIAMGPLLLARPAAAEGAHPWSRTSARLVNDAMLRGGPDEVLRALAGAGLLVGSEYERPGAEALFGRFLSFARMPGRVGMRWVMCRETHDHIASTLAAHPLTATEAGPVLGITVEGDHSGTASVLFGMPIRIDPAARQVMVELVER